MAAVLTVQQRVLNALNTKNESNLYLGIGRTTVWDDENNPDVPSTLSTEITELIYIKKISVKRLVISDSSDPDVTVSGNGYSYVDDADAYDQQAYRLYLSVQVDYDDIAPSDTDFRQIGVLLNPKDSGGSNLTDVEYLAASVSDQGELLYLDNRMVITRDPSQSEKFEIIISF